MEVISTARDMLTYAQQAHSEDRTIGFVPTMGALHKGHASLIEAAEKQCDCVVVSVFVNPTQFNQISDLEKYPRNFDSDRKQLEELKVDVMFFPSVDEIYPDGTDASFDLDGLDSLMEGPNRPGHFNGVVQVVTRLFDLVLPTKAFFGEKDFQQLVIIRHMAQKLNYDVEVVGCRTVRETDGLAMSSRNVRLSEQGKRTARSIYAALLELRRQIPVFGLNTSKQMVVERLTKEEGLRLEYLELVDPTTLNPSTECSKEVQACIAVWVDKVRLIDNLRVK